MTPKTWETYDILLQVTAIAHRGGLVGMDLHTALVAIRKLTKDYVVHAKDDALLIKAKQNGKVT
jgi:hypothetical protein